MSSKPANSQVNRYKVSWEEYDKDIRILANLIKKGGDDKCRVIYTLSRGGLVIACHLSHLLNIKNIVVDITPLMPYPILVVDDVSDTGKTLKEKVLLWRSPHITTIATLYRKDGTMVEPKYTVKTINKWIVFPWEE